MTGEATALTPGHRAIASLAAHPRLLVCCDFDGTISTIVDEPWAARPVDGAVDVLAGLARLPDTWTAIVSGRALADLKQLAGMPEEILLVGSHGAEFEVGAIAHASPAREALIARIAEQCSKLIAEVPGASLEIKPGSVAVHVRRADPQGAKRLLAEVRNGPATMPEVRLIQGKAVVELAVFLDSKADALDALRKRWEITATLFGGDDTTDEPAFEVLANDDVGVKVGREPTAAAWRVDDPVALVALLENLLDLRRDRGHGWPTSQGSAYRA